LSEATPVRSLSVVLVVAIVATAAAPAASVSDLRSPVDTTEATELPQQDVLNGTFGINFTVTYDRESRVVSLTARNGLDRTQESVFVVSVDNQSISSNRADLEPGESSSWDINITRGINAVDHSHSVTVSTRGDHVQYNFTEEFDPDKTNELPVPRITDVEVKNGTVRGEPSTVAMVTVQNPSIQTYGMKLMVFSEATDGSHYLASVRPKSSRTLKVELLDPRGELVAGEVRLYSGNLSAGDGGIDQVEFVGRADGETNHWNQSYEPVKGTWRKDNYVYQNESVPDSDADPLVDGVDDRLVGFGVAAVVIAILAVLLLGRRR
jgi:hypothetical protein